MPKMTVLRRVHYPSGPTGRDYQAGEEIEVATERDAKALRLLRIARDPETPAASETAALTTETAPRRSRTYRRSDLEAEQTKTVEPSKTEGE